MKDDAVPTLFDYNRDKQPSKRKNSCARMEVGNKKQLCEDAFERYDQWDRFEIEVNSKGIQTSPEMTTIGTQTDISTLVFPKSTSDQCTQFSGFKESPLEIEENTEFEENEYDRLSCNESDSEYLQSDSSEDMEGEKEQREFNNSAFIVFWSSLVVLLSKCFSCFSKTKLVQKIKGSLLTVTIFCSNGHKHVWRSQPIVNRQSQGNIKLSAAVLFSASTYTRIAQYFRLAGVQWIGKTRFYDFQKKYLAGVVNEAYIKENDILIESLLLRKSCCLSGDGRCDSPGHSAKYLTYSMLDQTKNTIISMSVTQVTEVGNSNSMEKLGFIKTLNKLKEKNVQIKQITTDRHKQIRKYIREEQKDFEHQFDVWHFCKNIRKKLSAAAKKKSCLDLALWNKSICNHLWWASATCGGDEILLREKWCSILFHIQNKHTWRSCSKFHKCEHPKLKKKEIRKKPWLKPDSDAFKVLQTIILNANTLKDLKHLTQFSHTGSLEIYHALYNKWLPKRQHFSHLGMVTRSQLAVMDFNAGSDMEQAKTKEGKGKFNLSFSKVTKIWSAKPIKEKKDDSYLFSMINRVIEIIEKNEKLDLPDLPKLPKNIAPIAKPVKEEVIKKQISRFI